MISVRVARPWLVAEFAAPLRVLSWAPHGAGYVTTVQVIWREVRNADLPIDFDVDSWFDREMAAYPGAVGMLTSRDIGTYTRAGSVVEGVHAVCVATLGLTNAEAVGTRRKWAPGDFGTINLCVATDAALSESAQLEAMSIAVQARTAAVIGAEVALPTGRATGTGTDCVALACVPGAGRYAGLHTPVGEAVGAAVTAAVSEAAAAWKQWYAGALAARR